MKPKRMMSHCPFCNAVQQFDKLHARFYACGTTADRKTGIYTKGCSSKQQQSKLIFKD